MNKDPRQEKNTFHALIDTEQRVQKQVEEEERRASRWLEQKQLEIHQHTEAALQRLDEENRQAIAEARQDAEEQARSIIRQAAAEARRLQNLDPQKLRDLVFKHLAAIDPRTSHDRPDVKN